MTTGVSRIRSYVGGLPVFFNRQAHDWKVAVIRQAFNRFFFQLSLPYLSIYIVALGATKTQLGLVNSIGLLIGGLIGPLAGWLVDRTGVRRVFLTGVAACAVSYLVYSVAGHWVIALVAMGVYWLGVRVAGTGCSTVCANSLTDSDRATGMNLCSALSSVMLIFGPMAGAGLVAAFGGVELADGTTNVGGIRPLFIISFAGILGAFVFLALQLSATYGRTITGTTSGFLRDVGAVLASGKHVKRWIVIASATWVPWGMIVPFAPIFAHENKGADEFILGLMVSAAAVVPLIIGIPMGRLADHIGRKKVIYLVTPVAYASNLLLVLTPHPWVLVAVGILQGFYMVGMVLTGAMTAEMVPKEHIGRWMGVIGLFNGLAGASSALLAGWIWDSAGPAYVFLTAVCLDLFVRMPLLLGIPETLGARGEAKRTPS